MTGAGVIAAAPGREYHDPSATATDDMRAPMATAPTTSLLDAS